MTPEAPNPLHAHSDPRSSWSTLNVAEALPGVATPLCWGIWSEVEHSPRAAFYAMGALERAGLKIPTRSEDRILNLFYGRLALRVDFLLAMADRIPGTTGDALARDIFGFVPPDYVSKPTKRRWPVVIAKLPREFLRTPRNVRRARTTFDPWWRTQIARVDQLDLTDVRAMYLDAAAHFRRSNCVSARSMTAAIQPVYQELGKLAQAAGVDAAALMRGHSEHEESIMISDLWEVSRDRMALDVFRANYGYHGPDEGELSARVWREDPAPLEAIVDGYRRLGDDESPAARVAEGARERDRAEAALLRALPRSKRSSAKLVLRLGRRYVPLRAVSKIAFVQSLDVGRAAARRGGALLAEQGVLDDPEDVFHLTREEFLGALPADVPAAVAERKALRARYEQLELPPFFTGQPEPIPIAAEVDTRRLEGIGVSPGVVEASVRVVTDPADTEMTEGEILVSHTTDPSWASVMFMASGLIVDIGGQLSHAAVVARELGIPCVMNTTVGTRALRTGDRCRIDGAAGTVELLARATSQTGQT